MFAVLITGFTGFCVSQTLIYHTGVPGWHGLLAHFGYIFSVPALIPIMPLHALERQGYHIPDWLGWAVFYVGLVLELAGVAWVTYRIGLRFVNYHKNPLPPIATR